VEDAERFKLLGTYRTPRCRIGQRVRCAVQGEVVIVALSDAPIPWPLWHSGSHLVPVVYKGLLRAVRRESEQAVVHWWGVGVELVWKPRKALGVELVNEGTYRLKRDYAAEPWFIEARAEAHAKARDPERCAKIAASKQGKPRPAHVVQAVIDAHLGTHHSEETRRQMSESHRRRGTRPPKAGRPWTAEEDELVRTLPIAAAAEKTGRTRCAVASRRLKLGLPDGRTTRWHPTAGVTGRPRIMLDPPSSPVGDEELRRNDLRDGI
jgi:hypothetical protein